MQKNVGFGELITVLRAMLTCQNKMESNVVYLKFPSEDLIDERGFGRNWISRKGDHHWQISSSSHKQYNACTGNLNPGHMKFCKLKSETKNTSIDNKIWSKGIKEKNVLFKPSYKIYQTR